MPAPRATLLFLAILVAARPAPAAGAPGTFDRSHATFTEILQRHIVDGFVDYAGLRQELRLDVYLSSLAAVSSDDLETWPEADRLAFWVNAYNALALRIVLDTIP